MKVSIIVPVYKVEEYVLRCFESIASQDFTNLEVIFVDDASTDSSIDIVSRAINEYSGPIEFKVVTHDKNSGLSAARNSGIDVATGQYIYFLDSDDELSDSKAISKFVKCAEQTKADVVVGNHENIKETGSYISKYKTYKHLHNQDFVKSFVKGDIPVTAWNKLIAKQLFDKGLRFKEGILNEDELFAYHLLFLNPVVVLLGEVTYNYYIRSGSIMTKEFSMHRLISPIMVYEEAVSSYKSLGENNDLILRNLDHFAFKRYIDVFRSGAECSLKRELYLRILRSQRSIKGVGIMRYVYNGHIYLPFGAGFYLMKLISQKYIKSRNL